jgi:cystathionine beta-lyase
MANPFLSVSLEHLRQRQSLKWRAFPPDVLPLWVAEMDLSMPPPVRRAVDAALDVGDTGYPSGDGYARAVAEFALDRWGWQVDPELTSPAADVMTGIVEVLSLLTDPGDPVVVNSPVYTPFYRFVAKVGRRIVESPLDADHRIDLGHLEQTFAAVTRDAQRAAYLLCSPHNPTGTVHTRQELEAVAGLAARYGVRVAVDEIHAPVVYPDVSHVPFLTLPVAAEAFVLVSASKAWNLAGIKSALIVAGTGAAQDLARLPGEVAIGASHLGTLAHVAALRAGGEWLDEVVAGLDENRRHLADLLDRSVPEIGYRPPHGTYLAWLDCRALGLDEDPAALFLREGRVALNSGPAFGTEGTSTCGSTSPRRQRSWRRRYGGWPRRCEARRLLTAAALASCGAAAERGRG